ncbi:MAG: hypothetical protein AAFY88_22315 [Acidobacteriota bacterium]
MLQAHIASCAACRGELAMIREDETEEPAPAPVVDFTDARRRRELIRSAPSQPRRRRFAIAAALAATVTGAVLVHSLNHRLEEEVSAVDTFAQAEPPVQVERSGTQESLRTSGPADALFADGFESGDTSNWTFVSN